MRPLYIPNPDHTLGYGGNKIFEPLKKLRSDLPIREFEGRVTSLHENSHFWEAIARINHRINMETHNYFDKKGSLFVLLPLTTKMISSPGALYGKGRIDYTQDTVPVTLKWFDLKEPLFLAESSQIYLELYLLTHGLDSAYCVYNSFRKERSDFSHLSEFHHIEYEGKVSQKENKKVIVGLVGAILSGLLKRNSEDLSEFLFDEDFDYLKEFSKKHKVMEISFEDALDILYKKTHDKRYRTFTSKYFGSWEEVMLSGEYEEILDISGFPLYEIAFYHAPMHSKEGNLVGDNSDFIWPYYREFIGSGHRVRSMRELLTKAIKFNLPKNDYKNYVLSRKFSDYSETSGFGLGWERLLQGILRMPYIYSASAFPRVDQIITP